MAEQMHDGRDRRRLGYGPGARYVDQLGTIVDRRRTDHALRAALRRAEESAGAAQSALKDAQHANAAKTQFLANVSHELRTPMNAIIGFSEILEKSDGVHAMVKNSSERSAEYGGYILHAANHLLGIINDLLDTAKIESGKFQLNECRVDLKAPHGYYGEDLAEPVVLQGL